MSNEHKIIDDFRKHIDPPDNFASKSDSNIIANLIHSFDALRFQA